MATRKRPLKLPLPTKWLTSWGDQPVALSEWADRFEQEGRALALAFDRRNQNAWHTQNFDEMMVRIRERRESRTSPLPHLQTSANDLVLGFLTSRFDSLFSVGFSGSGDFDFASVFF
jgi:uncharacterized protein (DUF2336 family)